MPYELWNKRAGLKPSSVTYCLGLNTVSAVKMIARVPQNNNSNDSVLREGDSKDFPE